MANLPQVDSEYLCKFLTSLLNNSSPTGYADLAVNFAAQTLETIPGMELQRTRKGALLAAFPGQYSNAPRMLSAHVDTLGAMVKEIKSNGRLKLTKIGGYAWNTVEGEGCSIFTNDGQRIRGSLLINQASAHVYGKKVSETPREDDNMEVRLDVRTSNAEQTLASGIQVGDFVAFDPRVEVVNGFVRSRHLDDKASVACIVTALKTLQDAGLKPLQKTYIIIANYEEVGHGASGVPEDVAEFLVVDMAAVGEGQTSDEFHSTLCVKDSGGPYHHGLSQRLRRLADEHQIDYRVDIYPSYSSDGTALWHTGRDVSVALIGPGVDASHNYERTHLDALVATTQWIMAYLLND
jgi:putative aminopeptidase FrvX